MAWVPGRRLGLNTPTVLDEALVDAVFRSM